MHYFLITLIPLMFLAAFLALVGVEARTGKRIFAARRYLLDRKAARAAFVARHVDWGAFASDLTRTSFERVLHDAAHASLLAVRAVERALTRLVRALRTRRDTPLPSAEARRMPVLEQARLYLGRIIHRSRKEPDVAENNT